MTARRARLSKICIACGVSFDTGRSDQILCGADSCRRSRKATNQVTRLGIEGPAIKSCVVCGGKFECCRRERRITCSGKCWREKNRASSRKSMAKLRALAPKKVGKKKRCIVCGIEFEAQRSAKTCSPACGKANIRARRNAWQKSNPEKRREYGRRDLAKHRAKRRATKKTWRVNNLQHALEMERQARERRGPKHAEASKNWREQYPERAKESAAKHRAKLVAALRLVRELQSKGMEALL